MHRVRSGSLVLCALASFAARANDLPAPEATEVWTPSPPLVNAPADRPPADAIVLFSGANLDEWRPVRSAEPLWRIEDGAMVVAPNTKPCNMQTKRAFGNVQLHVEFRTPARVAGDGQGRGNSGVFLMGLYELQVLDSWRNSTYVNGQAASIYKQHPPLVNASRPPGEWQTYDIVFVAPRFTADGKLARPARMTVFHNGVLVQYDATLRGPTVYRGEPQYSPHAAKLPLVLQDHGNPVAFRNIWIRELTLPE